MANQPTIGQRFSHVYLRRSEPAQDSVRMRRRMASLVWDFRDLSDFSSVVSRELGVDVPYNSMVSDWTTFFRDCELQDVLDLVTVGYRYLEDKKATGLKEFNPSTRWLVGRGSSAST